VRDLLAQRLDADEVLPIRVALGDQCLHGLVQSCVPQAVHHPLQVGEVLFLVGCGSGHPGAGFGLPWRVGQGRVDEILSTRSEDRRKVLEEASGIVKYKVRKDEAERKLLSTEQNLIRISDILSELGEQVGPLAEQSEKARKYHRLYEEWKSLDIGLSLHLIDRNQAFLSASVEEAAALTEDIRKQEDAILEMRTQNRVLSEKSNELEDSLEASRVEAQAITNAVHELQSSIAVIVDRRSHLSVQIDTSENEEGSAQTEIDRLNTEFNNQNK